MDADEARIVLRYARQYARQGHIPPKGLQAIEADCTAAIARSPQDRQQGVTLSQVLHALGGAVLAAAAIAAVLLLFPDTLRDANAYQAWALAVLGVAATAIGFALLRLTRNQDLADAFLVAGLACLAIMGFPDEDQAKALAPLGVLAAIAIPLARRGAMVGALASVAFALALARAFPALLPGSGSFFADVSDVGLWLWLLVAAAHFAAIGYGRFALGQRWLRLALAVEAVAIVLPLAIFIDEIVEPLGPAALHDDFGGEQLLLGLAMGGVLLLAVLRREAPLLVAAALVLAIDAIVFAFSVGGLGFGVAALLAVAVAVLVLGSQLRKRWSGPA